MKRFHVHLSRKRRAAPSFLAPHGGRVGKPTLGALSVPALDDAIRFYSTLFAAEPTVRKPDDAKWMLDDPRVNFAISQRGAGPGLNHLGIQVESDAELHEMQQRLEATEGEFTAGIGTACCGTPSSPKSACC